MLDKLILPKAKSWLASSECKIKSVIEYIEKVGFRRFISDRLQQKIDEYNEKKNLSANDNLLNATDEELENNEKPKKKARFKPIEISENGLELIELVGVDSTNAAGVWQSDAEIKIDKNGFCIRDGQKTRELWNGKLSSAKKPLRLKVRNIAGDESVFELEK